MNQPRQDNCNDVKKTPIIQKISITFIKPIYLVYAALVGIGAMLSLFLNAQELYKLVYEPELTLKFSPSGPVTVGTTVRLGYHLPEDGYYSLWNSNGMGKINRLLPPPKSSKYSLKISQKNQSGIRKLVPDTKNSKEEAFLLWTKHHADHPSSIKYDSEAEFRQYLEIHPYNWVEKKATLQTRK